MNKIFLILFSSSFLFLASEANAQWYQVNKILLTSKDHKYYYDFGTYNDDPISGYRSIWTKLKLKKASKIGSIEYNEIYKLLTVDCKENKLRYDETIIKNDNKEVDRLANRENFREPNNSVESFDIIQVCNADRLL